MSSRPFFTTEVLVAFALMGLSAALAACGSSANSRSNSPTVASASQFRAGAVTAAPVAIVGKRGVGTGQERATRAGQIPGTSRPTPATTGPGVGRPAVTVGDEDSPDGNLLGAIYAQALAAEGFNITLENNVGAPESTYQALTSGRIDMYPEYTGTLLSAVAGQAAIPTSASATYEQAKAFVARQGATLLDYTPFYESDALAVLPRYASAHGVSSIADLQRLGKTVTLGAAPEFAERFEGLIGLKREYGVDPTFKPIATELAYAALEGDQVDVQEVFTADTQLLSGKFELLADPKNLFGYQNIAPVVKQSVLVAEGPAFAQTLNTVSALLTTKTVQQMSAAVEIEGQPVTSVTQHFLAANGLS